MFERFTDRAIQLRHGYQGEEDAMGGGPPARASHEDRRLLDELVPRVSAMENRLYAIERHLATGPDTATPGQ